MRRTAVTPVARGCFNEGDACFTHHIPAPEAVGLRLMLLKDGCDARWDYSEMPRRRILISSGDGALAWATRGWM